MHLLSQSLWLQTADVSGAMATLGLGGTFLFACAWFASRRLPTATQRRGAWQVALAGWSALILLEMFGVSGSTSDWLRTSEETASTLNHSHGIPATAPAALEPAPAEPVADAPALEFFPSQLPDSFPSDDLPPEDLPQGEDLDALANAFIGPLPLTDPSADDSLIPPDTTNWPVPDGVASFGDAWFGASADTEFFGDLANAVGPGAGWPSDNGLAFTATAHTTQDFAPRGFWLAAIWAIGSSLFLAWSCGGRLLLMYYAWRLETNHNGAITKAAAEVAAQLGWRRTLQVKISQALAGPLAFGILRPTLVLPRAFSRQFTPEGQRAVLAHEIAHLRQGDPLWQLLGDLMTALAWWHPAAWLCRWQFKQESELAADEATLALEDGPANLASSLLRLGSRLSRPRALGYVAAHGTGLRSNLAKRIERLVSLDENTCRPRTPRPFLKLLAVMCLIASCLVGTAWARPGHPTGGDSNVNYMLRNWRTSFAGAALAAILAGGSDAAVAQDGGPPQPDQVAKADTPPEKANTDGELAAIEAEIVSIDNERDALIESLAQAVKEAQQESNVERDAALAHAQELQTRMQTLEAHVAELLAAGDQAAVDEARNELAAVRGTVREVEAEAAQASQRRDLALKNRHAEARDRLQSRIASTQERLARVRSDQNSAAVQRLNDRLALMRREMGQGAARVRRDAPPGQGDGAEVRRRAPSNPPQDAPPAGALRRRGGDDPGLDSKIEHIMAAAENLDAAGMHDQADALRRTAREMRGGDRGPAAPRGPAARRGDGAPDVAPPAGALRRRGGDAPPDATPPGDLPRRGRLAPPAADGDGPTPPARVAPPAGDGDAPRRVRAVGPGAPVPTPPAGGPDQPVLSIPRGGPDTQPPSGGPPQVVPSRRGPAAGPDAGNADRELLELIRSLKGEVDSLRQEVQSLRRDMNRDGGPDTSGRRGPGGPGRGDGGDAPARFGGGGEEAVAGPPKPSENRPK